MATTTTKDALPVPTLPDTRDVPRDFLALANAVDGKMIYPCTSATRPTGAARFDGRLIYETDTKAYGAWNGTAWRMFDTTPQTSSASTNVISNATPGMTGHSAWAKWFRQGSIANIHWYLDTGGAFSRGAVATLLLVMPGGLTQVQPNSTTCGTWRGTLNNAWQFGPVTAFTTTDPSYLVCYKPDGTILVVDTTAANGQFITATATVLIT